MFKEKNIYTRFFNLMGFSLINHPPPEMRKCILLFAPHTSNWDYILGLTCMRGLRMPVKVVIKKMWTKFPFGLIIKPLGGIGITRSDKKGASQVDKIANLISDYPEIALVVTPEGSRSLRTEWKTGFYYIAQKANLPIITIKGNYKNKTAEFGPVIQPGTEFEPAMKIIASYYADSEAKFPENFSVDQRYI